MTGVSSLKMLVAAALVGVLAACTPQPPQGAVAPTTAQVPTHPVSSNVIVSKSVLGVQQLYVTVGLAALEYVRLPRCGKTTARLCSSPAIARKIREYDQKAFDAIEMARRNELMIDFAWGAVQAFQAVIPRRSS